MRIHHVAFRTRDLPRLEAFYVGLGFEVVRRQPHGVWLAAGEAVVMLEHARDGEPEVSAKSMELVAFACPTWSLDGTRALLERLRVAIEAETAFTLYVRDPDGRRVGFSCFDLEAPAQA